MLCTRGLSFGKQPYVRSPEVMDVFLVIFVLFSHISIATAFSSPPFSAIRQERVGYTHDLVNVETGARVACC